jgi:hypothetical protein
MTTTINIKVSASQFNIIEHGVMLHIQDLQKRITKMKDGEPKETALADLDWSMRLISELTA